MGNQANRIGAMVIGESRISLFSLSGRARLRATFERLNLPVVEDLEQASAFDDILIAHADFVFDERVIADFARTRRSALAAKAGDGSERIAAVVCQASDVRKWAARLTDGSTGASRSDDEAATVYAAEEISGSYNQRLRKREAPLVAQVSPERKEALERRLFKGSYKGATDVVTKFVLPAPAFHATRIAAAAGIHPNLITTFSLLLVLLAFYYFWRGDFGPGLIAGWAMCFLDTVDGKLARVTLKSSKLGNIYDHGIDLIHPPFWYWAWTAGVVSTGDLSGLSPISIWAAFWTIFAGYIVGRLIEGYFVRRFKIEIHIWRPVDYWFRHITSRRNPNLLMLTASAAAGAPALGLVAVAVWSVASVAFHAVRLIAAEASAQNGALKSWLAE